MQLCRLVIAGLAALTFLLSPARAKPIVAGTMLVASDLHFDPMATPALADTLSAAPPEAWAGILAPELGREFSPYGRDSNWALLHAALVAMHQALPKPDLVILPGDFLAHDYRKRFDQAATDHSDAAYDRFVQSTIAFVGSQLRQTFPDTPILPTLGNNDDDCGDYGVTPDGQFLAGTADIVRSLARIDGDAAFEQSWRRAGGYVVHHPTLANTSILFVNTVFFSTHYQNACGKPGDDPAAAVLDWLDHTLADLKKSGRTAWLVYHIPPGLDGFGTAKAQQKAGTTCAAAIKPMWRPEIEARFDALMAENAGVVTASLAGHTHMDEFRLIGSNAYVLGTPGISPIFGQKPGFRVVSFDRAGGLVDAETWALGDLATDGAGRWEKEYDFDQTYGLDRIDVAGLSSLAGRLENDPAIRTRWETLYSVSRPERSGGITAENFPAYRCAIEHSDVAGYQACLCGSR